MKLFFCLPFVLCLCAGIVDCKSGGYREAILSCNAYMDSMIRDVLQENEDYFDPHPINESFLIFHKKVVFIDFKGEAKISEGYISGLRNLHRVSSCSLSFEQSRLRVSAKLEVDALAFNFTGNLKAININKAITGKGQTTKAFLSTSISLDAEGKDPILDNLSVDHIKDLEVEVEGLRILGWMEEPTLDSLRQFFKAYMEKLVEVRMKSLFAKRMEEKPFSLEKFNLDLGDFEVTTPEDDESLIGEPVYSKEDASSYIDSVLENRFQLEADYSKLSKPDFLTDHRLDKVFITNEKDNYVELKGGSLENLTKLKRIQDCSQPILRSSNITFTCQLGFQRLKFYYSAEARNGKDAHKFDVVAFVDDTKLAVKVTTTVQDNIPSMLNLKVNNLGKILVKAAHTIADAQLMRAEIKFDKKVIINHFSEVLRNILLGKLKDVLSYSIYKTPIHFIHQSY